MSARGLMSHRCTLRPVTTATTDALGDVVETAGTDATNVACRLEALGNNEELDQKASAVVATHRLWLPAGTVVTERTRVINVVDGNGATLMSAGDVEFVGQISGRRQTHHLECLVKELRT